MNKRLEKTFFKKRLFIMEVLLVVLLMLIIQCSVLINSVNAETITGSKGDISWSFDSETGTLTFSGSGEITNGWHYDNNLIDNATKVVIEEGITSIGRYAFVNCGNLTSITIPNSVSHIRATLIGENEKTNIGYAGDINLNTGNCLYNCLPSDLRNIIIAKKVKYVTNGSTLNEDIFDKIWLFSEREMYGTGKYTGGKLEGLGTNGDGYSKFGNTNSRYYLSSYNDKTTMLRRCYNETGIAANWSNRSPYNVNANSITHVRNDGGLTAFGNACGYNCLGFGFCIN